jgi:hypothetical protein
VSIVGNFVFGRDDGAIEGVSVVGTVVLGRDDGVIEGASVVGALVEGASIIGALEGASVVGVIVGFCVTEYSVVFLAGSLTASTMERQTFISQNSLQHSSPFKQLCSFALQKLA